MPTDAPPDETPAPADAPLDLLATYARTQGDKTAVIVDRAGGAPPSVTSFDELNRLVNRVAHGLIALGAEVGDRLVWCGPNSLEVIATIHAARKTGLVAVPLSYRFHAEEMQYVVDNSDATVVVVDAEQAPLIASIRDRLPRVRSCVVFGGPAPEGMHAWSDLLADAPDTEPPHRAEPGDIGAAMMYTSGTTGKPKGALRSSSDPTIVFALLMELGLGGPEHVHLTTGPLYHSGPNAFHTLAHSLGNTIVVLRKFDAEAWLRIVGEYGVTNTFSAPTQLKRIVNQPRERIDAADLSSMRCFIANAAPVPYPLKEEAIDVLGAGSWLYEVYGSTELGIVTVLKPEDQLRKPGSCGQVFGGVGVRVVDDDGYDVPTGVPGELFISTGIAMDGYHRTDEDVARLPGEPGVDGTGAIEWKSVGDVAYLDDERFVHICDRKKDMIISGGVNIYPAEVEAVLHAHPDVLDAAVFGIPDDEWGESVYAIVQPKDGHTIDLDPLRDFVEARLGRYQRPRGYEVRAELPRTESGKLLKRLLRDEFWGDRTSRI